MISPDGGVRHSGSRGTVPSSRGRVEQLVIPGSDPGSAPGRCSRSSPGKAVQSVIRGSVVQSVVPGRVVQSVIPGSVAQSVVPGSVAQFVIPGSDPGSPTRPCAATSL